ncbi:DUF2845 domain-containing protein [Lederbergia sp. NSJ-179]|uniref:DUF2845 domain-containing protein n=1 Tax=Lederbergia sp. NSJ-179 TaxID=2931402 RepID=UPI001FD288B9|nr:DUF2845 domain-containing protein [Lederbergia sp. NSJ-179]MCJ7841762.1 DUF2845 domain-containing protein [Lederbergia sp. NSJ-179]
MLNSNKLFLLLLLLPLMVACSNNSIETNTKQDAKSKIEEVSEQRELTEEDQKYIQLLKEEKYDKVIEETKELNDDDLLKDYYFLAVAFDTADKIDMKIQDVDSELVVASILQNQYGNIKDSIENVSFIPDELKKKVNELNELATSKYTYYTDATEEQMNEAKDKFAEEEKIKEEIESANKPRTVRIGMTEEEVINEGWGVPKKKNRTTNKYGTSEQWVYDGNNYLYFEDGILTTIQN